MCEELTDSQFLLDLVRRRFTMKYGQEQRDAERLEEMADRIEEKTFKLHWLDGPATDIKGTDIADACRRAGVGNGALLALDYFEQTDETA